MKVNFLTTMRWLTSSSSREGEGWGGDGYERGSNLPNHFLSPLGSDKTLFYHCHTLPMARLQA